MRPNIRGPILASVCLLLSSPLAAEDSPVSVLTWPQARQRLLESSPRIQAQWLGITAQSGGARQDALWPNPELSVEAENFNGSGPYERRTRMEMTYLLRQPLPIGGRTWVASDVADRTDQLARLNAAIEVQRRLARAESLFHQVLHQQSGLELAEERLETAARVADAARLREAAGKAARMEVLRAQSALEEARILRAGQEARLRAVAGELAALWGGVPEEKWTLESTEEGESGGMDTATLQQMLEASLEWRRWDALTALQDSAHSLEIRKAIPDITVGAGWRTFNEEDERAWVVDVSLPLPLFDRNQGGIGRAEAEDGMARLEAEEARRDLLARATASHLRLTTARESEKSLVSVVEPAAREAFALAEKGYRAGKFNYLELADAQRAWFDAREKALDARLEKSLAEIELRTLLASDDLIPNDNDMETKP